MNDWTPPSFVMLGNMFITWQVEKDKSTGKDICTTSLLNIKTGQTEVIHTPVDEIKENN